MSLTGSFVELQADSMCRRYPSLRIASLRFHWVVPTPMQSREALHKRKGNPKDLWSFVSLQKTAEACLLGITVEPKSGHPGAGAHDAGDGVTQGGGAGLGWEGHETFFIAARTTCQQSLTAELVKGRYDGISDLRFKDEQGREREMRGNEALIDTSKAERLLGWKDEGYPYEG